MPVSGWFGLRADEGRAKQRNASGRCKGSMIRGFSNGTSLSLNDKSVRMGNLPK